MLINRADSSSVITAVESTNSAGILIITVKLELMKK